jgi:hypothetical protein
MDTGYEFSFPIKLEDKLAWARQANHEKVFFQQRVGFFATWRLE